MDQTASAVPTQLELLGRDWEWAELGIGRTRQLSNYEFPAGWADRFLTMLAGSCMVLQAGVKVQYQQWD